MQKCRHKPASPLHQLRDQTPANVAVRLSLTPGEAAQVDFGAGPILMHPQGTPRRTWAFVMTLCHSRHQYVEFVWDQSSATWLGCHLYTHARAQRPGERKTLLDLLPPNARAYFERTATGAPPRHRRWGRTAPIW